MSRRKILYIVSLVILVVLVGFTVIRPMAAGRGYSEVQREQLLQAEGEWIIQFNIINHEGEDKNYTINALTDGKLHRQDVLIPNGATFTYVHHVYPERLTEGKVSFAFYKEGEATPFEETTYYLK